MTDFDLDAIRERDTDEYAVDIPGCIKDRHDLLEHIAKLEWEREFGQPEPQLDAESERIERQNTDVLSKHTRLRAAAQAVVDMNRELLDAIDALDAALEVSTEDQ